MIDVTIEGPRSVSSPLGLLTNDEDLEYPIDSEVQIFLRPDDLIHDDDSSYQATLVGKHFRGAHHLYEVNWIMG